MIMVDIYFPAVDETHTFRLDENVKVKALIQEIAEMMGKKYRSVVNTGEVEQAMLCTLENNMVLSHETSLAQSEVVNGDRLMFL